MRSQLTGGLAGLLALRLTGFASFGGRGRPFPVTLSYGVENRLDLKRRQVRMRFHHQGDDADDVGTGKAVARQLPMPSSRPGSRYLHPRRDQLDDLPVAITEVERITTGPFDHRHY